MIALVVFLSMASIFMLMFMAMLGEGGKWKLEEDQKRATTQYQKSQGDKAENIKKKLLYRA